MSLIEFHSLNPTNGANLIIILIERKNIHDIVPSLVSFVNILLSLKTVNIDSIPNSEFLCFPFELFMLLVLIVLWLIHNSMKSYNPSKCRYNYNNMNF